MSTLPSDNMPSDGLPSDNVTSDNVSRPIDARTDQGTNAPDWRSGILALSVIAFTALIAAYGLLAVEPSIPNRYDDICKQNFQKLGFASTDSPSVEAYLAILKSRADQSNNGSADENATEKWSVETDQAVLEQIHLCLRRLQVLNPSNDQFRYQAAIVSEMLSELFFYAAHHAPRTSEDKIDELLARSEAERSKAKELMISLQSKQSDNASKAALWLVSNQLKSSAELFDDELAMVDGLLTKATANSAEPNQPPNLSARIQYLRSVNLDANRSANERQELAKAASKLLSLGQANSIVDRAWTSETMFLVDTNKARSLAWQSVQNYWSQGEPDYQRPEDTAAMFQCLLRSSNLKESQVFLGKRLPKLPTKDQQSLRKHASMACVRSVVADSIQKHFKAEFESIPAAQLIELAVQLDPESNELRRLVLQIATTNRDNDFLHGIAPEIKDDTTSPIGNLIQALSSDEQTPKETREQAFSSFVGASPSHAIFATRVVDSLLKESQLDRNVAIEWLRTVNDRYPNVLSAWSIRAGLHTENQELDKAIDCFEHMSEQLPANLEIKNAIQELRSRQNANSNPPS